MQSDCLIAARNGTEVAKAGIPGKVAARAIVQLVAAQFVQQPVGRFDRADRLRSGAEFWQRENRHLVVPLGLGVALDDGVDQLRDLRFQVDLAALPADQGGHVFELVQLASPGLLVGDGFVLQFASALGTDGWRVHKATSFSSSTDRPTLRDRIGGR